ncbi:PE family protein PE14 [Mycobacterium tuberculosis]|nr:PE family protein PE14 [Mycobacterium tuberculosis]
MLAACADEVSAVVASLFARHAQAYQALSLQATAFHQQFVQALTGAGGPMRLPKPSTLLWRRACSKTC